MSVDVKEAIARLFRQFAVSARGRSTVYERLGAAVASDDDVLAFVASLPSEKWQPNLLFGAVRFLRETVDDPAAFRKFVLAEREELAAVITARVTQTNEPARCATLLPALAQLPQPLALLEVGASAGLCLLPDRYSYDYGRAGQVPPATPMPDDPVLLRCQASRLTPIPTRNVEIAWRAGLDLRPVDINDADQIRWLEALIWPGEEYRIPQLHAAIALARCDQPRVVRGDLRTDVPALAARAPDHATLVIFHTAVLGYITDAEQRAGFAHTVADLDAVWIANEGPEITPGIAQDTIAACPAGAFLLCVDSHPTAWTDPHGAWISWLGTLADNS